MRKSLIMLLTLCSLFLCGLAFSESKSLPPIDGETLIAALKHKESLLISGKAEEVVNTLRDFQSERYVYAFRGAKTRYYRHLGPTVLKGTIIMYDGRIQVNGTYPHEMGDATYVGEPPFGSEWDPLDWGHHYENIPLSEYLEKYGVLNIRIEELDGVPCYVIETHYVFNKKHKVYFWISPTHGFSYLQYKRSGIISGSKYPAADEMYQVRDGTFDTGPKIAKIEIKRVTLREYDVGEETVWFVEEGELQFVTAAEPHKVLNYTHLEVKGFQANVDVMDLFDPGIPPNYKVMYDPKRPKRAFKEFGWNP